MSWYLHINGSWVCKNDYLTLCLHLSTTPYAPEQRNEEKISDN